MRGIDEQRANLLHEGMSRPSRLLLPAACAFLSLGFSACVGTVYDRMYSNKKTHFKAPAEKKEASAEDILGAVGNSPTVPTSPDGLPPADAGGALPPPPGDIPGLPPATPDASMAPPPL
jgi:hypothetical protein